MICINERVLMSRKAYLPKAALPQDLVEDEVVHLDAAEVVHTGHRPDRAGPLPQFTVLSIWDIRCR